MGLHQEQPRHVRGRPFEKGRRGDPGGSRVDFGNKTTVAPTIPPP
jgi:hypothetical protein